MAQPRDTDDTIEAAKAQAAEAIIRNNITNQNAYICRWGSSRYLGFFFSTDDTAAENNRARAQATEGKRFRIVGRVTPEEAKAMKGEYVSV